MYALVTIVLALAVGRTLGASIPNEGNLEWWKHSVFYQIYPRSFKDSNNDGIGDLQGIISKLHEVKAMGVNATWLSPIYKSPQVDQGYDISDYRAIAEEYGTLDDMMALLEKAAELGLKIIMDLVPNHTSDKHEWFIESEKGNEKYKDYYIWRDGKINEKGERAPPNNWISVFSNSAWTWSDIRQQYYLHAFAPQQPDLNYRNPAVVQEIKDIMTFWLDMGVQGFRVDAVPFLIEDEELRDEPRSDADVSPTNYAYLNHIYTQNLPGTYDVVYQLRKHIDDYSKERGGDARIFMTESYADVEHTMLYYGTPDGQRLGAHFTFNFNLITDLNINSTADDFVKTIKKWLDNVPDIYVSNWVLGNHDQHRVATRLRKNNVDGLNMLMALLPGVGVTYNGEEIGMENGEVKYEEGKDPSARDPATFDAVSRDFERTPYQWDRTVNAGFNEGAKPWLPVSKKYLDTNLELQKNPQMRSHYNVYRDLLTFRQTPVPTHGNTEVTAVSNVIVLKRQLDDDVVLVVFNIRSEDVEIDVSEYLKSDKAEVVIPSYRSSRVYGETIETKNVLLVGFEALVLSNVKS